MSERKEMVEAEQKTHDNGNSSLGIDDFSSCSFRFFSNLFWFCSMLNAQFSFGFHTTQRRMTVTQVNWFVVARSHIGLLPYAIHNAMRRNEKRQQKKRKKKKEMCVPSNLLNYFLILSRNVCVPTATHTGCELSVWARVHTRIDLHNFNI